MTDDEFLKLCRVASKTQQMKVLLMTTTLVEYKRRRKKAQQNRQRRQAQENAHETTNAPLVVIPTPVEPVEKKPLDTLKILPTDDDETKKRKLKEIQKICQARCRNNDVQNDEDILRGKIKPDED